MASRTIKTPGATTPVEETQTTAEKADEALEQITKVQAEEPITQPSYDDMARQLADMQAQMAELKKSTQVGASASLGSTGEVKPKKRVPVLTDQGWTTKEAD